MRTPPTIALTALLLVTAGCSDSGSTDTTAAAATSTSTTTTTTLIPTTSSSTTTPEATTTTTTTEPEETTTTSEATDETSTTTTTRVEATTTTTTEPPDDADPNLVPWAGLFRQPTAFNGFLDFQSNGVIRAGTSIDNLDITGRWDYDNEEDEFIFFDFDFGAGCNGSEGRYALETAFGGGRRILLVEDPCEDRVNFITQPGSSCQCFLYNRVEIADD
ncbi:MAG: hypothetical protein IH941_02535 [Acidobacteria bacterium]|nr:hypothetical protein [Acidobacteriota bacterium]